MMSEWDDLFEGLTMLRRGTPNESHPPFHCEHDTLWVNSDPEAFTPEELAELDELGFFPDEYGFTSGRFGSA